MTAPTALALLVAAASLLAAQQPVTPSGAGSGESREAGNYLVSNSFEAGYRGRTAGGDADLYRAAVNYGAGARLFAGTVRVAGLEGRGAVDEFVVRTSGAPGEPYQSHSIRVEKDGVFRYELRYRLHQYRNRLPALWSGERGLRTERSDQAQLLTLRPGTRFEFQLGYDRNRRSGPAFGSEAVADGFAGFDRQSFLRFLADLRQRTDTYRGGLSARVAGLAVTVMHAADLYDERAVSADAAHLPTLAGNVQPVEALVRSEPFRGRTPVTTLALRTAKERSVGFTARLVHSGGYRNSRLLENVTVADPASSASTVRDTLVSGGGRRRQGSGEFTAVILPSSRWTVTNTSAFHNTRIDGQVAFLETGLYDNEFLAVEHLAVRRLSNAAEVTFRPVRQVGLFGAHRYSTRRVRSSEGLRFGDFGFGLDLAEVDNAVHATAAGVRWMPLPGIRASADLEVGRADRPLAPTAEREFRNESLRARWRGREWSAGSFWKRRSNDNPTELLAFSSKSAAWGLSGSWLRPGWGLAIDASYALLSLDVAAGILNLFDFGTPDQPDRGRSAYRSRIHNAQLGLQWNARDGVTLALAYSLTKDVGAGRGDIEAVERDGFSLTDAALLSSLPMSYHSPSGRLSVRVAKSVTWNLGWQHYAYTERFRGRRGFRAHVGYSSLALSF